MGYELELQCLFGTYVDVKLRWDCEQVAKEVAKRALIAAPGGR